MCSDVVLAVTFVLSVLTAGDVCNVPSSMSSSVLSSLAREEGIVVSVSLTAVVYTSCLAVWLSATVLVLIAYNKKKTIMMMI